jgi:hypothetical protein
MRCPQCASEYSENAKACIDCRVLLVDGPGVKLIDENRNGKLIHFITCFSRQEAESGRSLLEIHDIEAIVSRDEIRGIRLWIHKEDAQSAIKIFQERTAAEKKSV